MQTKTLLPYVRVVTYDVPLSGSTTKRDPQTGRPTAKRDINFRDQATADAAIERCGTKVFNVYRIEKVNGTWRTDWELTQ